MQRLPLRLLHRYIKKKGLEPIDTYVPPVLQARQQLRKAGEIMGKDAAAARSLLREGAFDGLRDNIRALGEYAVQNDSVADSSGLVASFFGALENYDFRLFEAGRFSRPVAEDAPEQLQATLTALDRLLATVPKDEMAKAEEVMRVINDKLAAIDKPGDEAAAADSASALEKQLVAPSSPAT